MKYGEAINNEAIAFAPNLWTFHLADTWKFVNLKRKIKQILHLKVKIQI